MWPFIKSENLPGIKQESNGEISFTLTDEEDAEIRNHFSALKSASGESELYVHPEAHRAMTAWALIGYSQSQVLLCENADPGIVDRSRCIRKALAAAAKAYSLHSLPIYLFDMACLLEMLGNTASAKEAFRTFLTAQSKFQPTDLDTVILRNRNVDEAQEQARRR